MKPKPASADPPTSPEPSANELRRRIVQLEAALEEKEQHCLTAYKELDGFAYSVSHDLRAPLRAIEGFSRIVLEDFSKDLDPEACRYLEIVSSSAGKMQRLIDDLLEFSRLSRSPIEPVPLDMMEIASTIVQEFQQTAGPRKVEVRISPLPAATGDARLIRKVFQQLISNAFKFTAQQPHPVVEIGSQPFPRELAFFVRDNGIGFDMQYAPKLFGVFQRLHAPEEFGGTGIGLAIVQRIVHRHGGRVWAEAKVNHGATFYFTWPQAGD